MKTTKITVVGTTSITSKRTGKLFTVVHFTYSSDRSNTTGLNVGSVWLEGFSSLTIDADYDGVLGFDRSGHYGVVDII